MNNKGNDSVLESPAAVAGPSGTARKRRRSSSSSSSSSSSLSSSSSDQKQGRRRRRRNRHKKSDGGGSAGATLPAPALRLHHLALRGTEPHAAMQRALTLASSWPLTRATIFDVMQSFTSNWPRALWLAVDARGLTLLRRGARAALVSHDHSQLLAVSPAPRALLLVTRADRKHAKLVLSTDQAYQIATLIKDYIEAVRGPVCPAVAAS